MCCAPRNLRNSMAAEAGASGHTERSKGEDFITALAIGRQVRPTGKDTTGKRKDEDTTGQGNDEDTIGKGPGKNVYQGKAWPQVDYLEEYGNVCRGFVTDPEAYLKDPWPGIGKGATDKGVGKNKGHGQPMLQGQPMWQCGKGGPWRLKGTYGKCGLCGNLGYQYVTDPNAKGVDQLVDGVGKVDEKGDDKGFVKGVEKGAGDDGGDDGVGNGVEKGAEKGADKGVGKGVDKGRERWPRTNVGAIELVNDATANADDAGDGHGALDPLDVDGAAYRAAMMLVQQDHTSAKFTDAEQATEDFMSEAWKEDAEAAWLKIEKQDIKSYECPWDHPRLISTIEDNNKPDQEHYQRQSWSWTTLAMYKAWTPASLEGHSNVILKAAHNTWCPNVKGDILVYRVCLCDHDGSNHKCIDDMDVERILQLLNDTVSQHSGFKTCTHLQLDLFHYYPLVLKLVDASQIGTPLHCYADIMMVCGYSRNSAKQLWDCLDIIQKWQPIMPAASL